MNADQSPLPTREEIRKETKPAPAHRTSPAWGAICPHDDYLYAGRSYHILLRRMPGATLQSGVESVAATDPT